MDKRTRIAVLVLLWLLCASNQKGVAQQNGAASISTAHIRVEVRQMNGDPIAYLQKKNFRIVLAGRQLPVTALTRDQKRPTRVLALISPEYAASGSSNDMVLKDFPASFNRQEISIIEANGAATGFTATRPLLSAEIHSARAGTENFQQAIEKLGTYTGARAVIYVTSKSGRTPLYIRQAARKADALIYQVGGDIADNYVYEGDETTTGALPVYGQGPYGANAPPADGMQVVNNTEIWESGATLAIRDVYVERTIHAALREIARNNSGCYDLEVSIPSNAKALTLGLTMKQAYQISAQAYTLDRSPSPDILLQGQKF